MGDELDDSELAEFEKQRKPGLFKKLFGGSRAPRGARLVPHFNRIDGSRARSGGGPSRFCIPQSAFPVHQLCIDSIESMH